MPARVFISYRRRDSVGHVHALQARISAVLGDGQVYLDVDSIALGTDFFVAIDQAIEQSEVLIAVIGPHWAGGDVPGRRRIDDPADLVRHEVETALAAGIRVVPLLLGGAQLPQPDDLPPSLAPLGRHQGFEIRDDRFADDLSSFVQRLCRSLHESGPGGAAPLASEHSPRTEGTASASDNANSQTAALNSLAEQVRRYWIDGVLESSAPCAQRVSLGYKLREDLLPNPFADFVNPTVRTGDCGLTDANPVADLKSADALDLGELFDHRGHQLLLLGEPGAGKTTSLLMLAERLLETHAQRPSAPLPLVLHLAGWRPDLGSFGDWVVAELNGRYRIPMLLGGQLLKQQRLVLLLDALDEVPDAYREDCAMAIRDWVEANPEVRFVISSRRADYERLGLRIPVTTAVGLRPLTDRTLQHLWQTMGVDTVARRVLLADAGLDADARTPLMAMVAARAPASGMSPTAQSPVQVDPVQSEPGYSRSGRTSSTHTSSTRALGDTTQGAEPRFGNTIDTASDPLVEHSTDARGALFDAYIAELFRRCPPARAAASPEDTLPLLARISERMVGDGIAHFQIESIDDRWFPAPWQRLLFGLLFGALLGLVGGAVMAFYWGLITPVLDLRDLGCPVPVRTDGACMVMAALRPLWLLLTPLWGMLLVLLDCRLPLTAPGEPPMRRIIGEILPVTLAYLMVWMLLWTCLLSISTGAVPSGAAWMVPLWLSGLMLSLLVSAWRAQRSGLTGPVRTLEALGWRWRHALRGMSYGLLAGLGLWAINALAVRTWMLQGLPAYLLLATTIGALLGGLRARLLGRKIRPNEGIHLSLRNALLGAGLGALGGIFAGIASGILFWRLYSAYLPESMPAEAPGQFEFMLRYAIADGVALAFIAAVWLGGAEVIKHLLLRLLLALGGRLPIKLAGRLDAACELGLMQRVGGSWIFSHRLLAEHLAARRQRYEAAENAD